MLPLHPSYPRTLRWNGETVIKTEDLARLYGITSEHLYATHRYHFPRAQGPIHRYQLTGDDLQAFRVFRRQIPESQWRSNIMVVWTEAGARCLAEILGILDAFEMLQRCYLHRFRRPNKNR